MLFISVFLLIFAFSSAYTEDQTDINKYIDEILSVHLPRHVKNADLDVYEVPDFYFNVRDNSASNDVFVGNVTFYRGNLTGLSVVHRGFCQRSLTSTDSFSIICNIVLPRIDVRYRIRYEVLHEHSSSYKDLERKREFFGDISVRNVEAQIELKAPVDGDQLTVTNLLLLGEEEVRKRLDFSDVNKNGFYNHLPIPIREISTPFFKSSYYAFEQALYGSFRNALERAVASVSYPLEHY
ncbi:uncharacterized protein TNCT_266781 [Trichonephila clavata]|uniref:Secreted protein n=1 Tax=Trichonephila clavata TaxID=2740835 RepID=A0A8X6KP31_TRICU|nr:uncharacterized protein TNCT_266781 [Trichonephila clavata]